MYSKQLLFWSAFSEHLNTSLVWYSNGQKESDCHQKETGYSFKIQKKEVIRVQLEKWLIFLMVKTEW
jgi:hypothetical protein